jgi:predicted RNA-binding protein with EMAP domain
LDLNKDGIVDESEMLAAKQEISELENTIQTQSFSGWRKNKMQSIINVLKSKIGEDDQTKTY